MVGRSPRKPIERSALQKELIRLLKHEDGVNAAERLLPILPELEAHPAVRARMARYDKYPFREALIEALDEALDSFDMDEAPRQFLLWQFGLNTTARKQSAALREAVAIELAGKKTSEAYKRDRPNKATGQIKKSPRTVALDRLEKYLAALPAVRLKPTSHAHTVRVIRIGSLEIDRAISIASCDKEQSSAQELLLEFEKDLRPSRTDPDEWPPLEAQLLPVLQEEARKRIAKFENDSGLDLVHVEHRPSTLDGPHRLRIGVAETGYYLWAATANSLDRDLSDFPDLTNHLGEPTLRQGWNSDPSSLADLTRQPAPAYMGVCVVVIAEGKIVVLKRQRDHYVANTTELIPAHFVGEGMTPKDLDASGRFSPEEAARRGCVEELGTGPSDHFQFIPTGVIVDTKRWQPLFSFVAECNLPIPRLERSMKKALDRYETASGEIATSLPWTAKNEKTLALLTGDHPTFSLASNHAQAALLHALYYRDGRDEVDDLLERDAARSPKH
jgi:hypothetical protein